MKTILFVCSGNIARSVFAEHLLQKILNERGLSEKYRVHSCGLQGSAGTPAPKYSNLSGYELEYVAALPSIKQFGIDITSHISTAVEILAVRNADVIIAMDSSVLSDAEHALVHQFPEERSKMRLFSELSASQSDIVDPYGNSDEQRYAKIIREIDHTLRSHINLLLSWVNQI